MKEIDKQIPLHIGIRPEVTVLSVLRHLNYKAWFAIAEFIDNALQSAISKNTELQKLHNNKFQLIVDVRIDATAPGQIVITDNAGGISQEDFPRAFRTAQTPSDRSGLSEFGMGMKSAACWFAETWSVRTKAIGEPVERTIKFDVKHIVENKIDNLDVTFQNADVNAHYTVVSLRGLHHPPHGRTVGKIKDHLESIYRVFLRNGKLKLSLNDELLSYQSPKVLKSIKYNSHGLATNDEEAVPVEWKKEINLDFGDGQKVTGFAALREVGSTPLAGFALFRRDRLIVGSHDETYRPSYIFKHTNSYPYQRLFGELHVEGFEISHTKDGFRWEQYEDNFLELLKEELEREPLNLIYQAENYRALPTKKSISKQAETATASVADHIKNEVEPVLTDIRDNPHSPQKLPIEIETTLLQASERIVDVDDGDWKWIITLRTSIDPARDEWVSVSKLDKNEDDLIAVRRLCIDVSLAHPFSTEFLGTNNENIELFLRFSSSICISLMLSEDITGQPPQSFLYHFNSLLRGALIRTNFTNDNINKNT